MLDFPPVRRHQVTMNKFAADLTPEDFRHLTEESIAGFEALLADVVDAEITFVPDDPAAADQAAGNPDDRQLAWTVGHNIVHATASGEEYAAVAAELAHGVEFHGRPRFETPWQTVTTVAHCRQRLAESRRIRLASLEMWPDRQDLSKGYAPWQESGWVNAQGIFAWGLAHDDDHRRQIEKIVR